jgi:hypothetical protein
MKPKRRCRSAARAVRVAGEGVVAEGPPSYAGSREAPLVWAGLSGELNATRHATRQTGARTASVAVDPLEGEPVIAIPACSGRGPLADLTRASRGVGKAPDFATGA